MVNEGIVLRHRVSRKGIEVDKAKIETTEKLPPPTLLKGIKSFLGHTSFYKRFIRDFSKISKPLSSLLMSSILFDEKCMIAFTTLKAKLTSIPIVIAPNWKLLKCGCIRSYYRICVA